MLGRAQSLNLKATLLPVQFGAYTECCPRLQAQRFCVIYFGDMGGTSIPVRVATRMVALWPPDLRVATLERGCPLLVKASSARETVDDVAANHWILKACLEQWPDRVPSVYELAEALRLLDNTFSGRVFSGGPREALCAAGDLKRLLQVSRRRWRQTRRSKIQILEELKGLMRTSGRMVRQNTITNKTKPRSASTEVSSELFEEEHDAEDSAAGAPGGMVGGTARAADVSNVVAMLRASLPLDKLRIMSQLTLTIGSKSSHAVEIVSSDEETTVAFLRLNKAPKHGGCDSTFSQFAKRWWEH